MDISVIIIIAAANRDQGVHGITALAYGGLVWRQLLHDQFGNIIVIHLGKKAESDAKSAKRGEGDFGGSPAIAAQYITCVARADTCGFGKFFRLKFD
jgi:hypothetical protein